MKRTMLAGATAVVPGWRQQQIVAAPSVTSKNASSPGHFDRQSQKVDAYWKAHLSNKISNQSDG
jgi:hypothetical protein